MAVRQRAAAAARWRGQSVRGWVWFKARRLLRRWADTVCGRAAARGKVVMPGGKRGSRDRARAGARGGSRARLAPSQVGWVRDKTPVLKRDGC